MLDIKDIEKSKGMKDLIAQVKKNHKGVLDGVLVDKKTYIIQITLAK